MQPGYRAGLHHTIIGFHKDDGKVLRSIEKLDQIDSNGIVSCGEMCELLRVDAKTSVYLGVKRYNTTAVVRRHPVRHLLHAVCGIGDRNRALYKHIRRKIERYRRRVGIG